MLWRKAYKHIDYLQKSTFVESMWFTKVLTLVILFHNWDTIAGKYLELDRYCYIFPDGLIAYGQ